MGRVGVSVSWGKDSIALADMAINALGPIPLYHLASPYSLPGYEQTIEHFAARAPLTTIEAARSLDEYIEWCGEIGLPHERERSVQKRAVKSIKTDRGSQAAHDLGVDVQMLGMRIDEKGPRADLLRARGLLYFAKTKGLWISCPIGRWSNRDVWAYIASRDLPYNRRIYDAQTHGYTRETIRNTGWLSTDGAHDGRIAWLAHHFPSEYETLAEHFPRVRMLR